jgi:hypothetical protein
MARRDPRLTIASTAMTKAHDGLQGRGQHVPSDCPAWSVLHDGVVEAIMTRPWPPWPVLVYLPRLAASVLQGYRCPHRGAKTARTSEDITA